MMLLKAIGKLRPHLLTSRYSTHAPKFTQIENYFRVRDGIPKKWELIYKAPMENALKYATTYVTLTSGGFVCLAAYIYSMQSDPSQPIFLSNSDVIIANNLNEFSIYIGAFVLLHLAVRMFLSKYVVRLYKSENEYLAVYRGWLFNAKRTHQFSSNNVRRLKPSYILPWGDAHYEFGSKRSIVLPNYFKSPQYFNQLTDKKSDISDNEE